MLNINLKQLVNKEESMGRVLDLWFTILTNGYLWLDLADNDQMFLKQ